MAVHLTTERMRVPKNGRLNSADVNKFVDSTITDLQNMTNQVNINEVSTENALNTVLREMANLKQRVIQLEDSGFYDDEIRAAQNLRVKAFKAMTDLKNISFLGTNDATKPRINTLFGQATLPINAIENKFYTNSIISGSIVPVSQTLNIEVSSVIDGVDYEAGHVKLTEGNSKNAFNGDNQSYWQRKVEFDLNSDVEEVIVDLVVQVPDQANTEANIIYIRPYPVAQVDILNLGHSGALSGAFTYISQATKDNAKDSRYFISTQSVQRLHIRLRQRNWYEENGRKVFSYGLQELGLQLVEFDKTYSASANLSNNHTFVTRFTCPEGYKFKGLHMFNTSPNYIANKNNMHFKVALGSDGTNTKWDSDINTPPENLVQPIDLGGSSAEIYVISTLNYIAETDPIGAFFANTTPVLESIGLQYSVVSAS
jgi:hypothetical protein